MVGRGAGGGLGAAEEEMAGWGTGEGGLEEEGMAEEVAEGMAEVEVEEGRCRLAQ